MAYRRDEQFESGLLPTRELGSEKVRSWDILATFSNQLRNRASGYHAPLSERWMLLVVVDALCVIAAMWGTNFFWPLDQRYLPELWYAFPITLFGWWMLAYFNDLYDVPSSCDWITSAMRVVVSGLLGFALALFVNLLFSNPLPNRFLLSSLAVSLLLIIAWRLVYARLSGVLFSPHRLLLIGLKDGGELIGQLLKPASRLNYQVVGFVDDDPAVTKMQGVELPLLGQITDVPHLVESLHVHEVVVDMKQALTAELFELLITCQGQGVQISWMPDLYSKFRHSTPIQHIVPSWALYSIQGQPIFSRLQLVGKRCLDLAIIVMALPTLLTVMPMIALAIRLDSPGPIFYHQTRLGRGGKPFTIFKFRTMVPNAEKDGTPQWAAKNDPRITRVGQFLRKTRLDELPQVFNVLRGEMSFVGPRPERPEFVAQLEREIPFYGTRLLVKPGLTGWAQIHYDYGSSVTDAIYKLQFDFYYIQHWSLWMDIYIVYRTVAVVLQGKGT